MKRRKFIGSTLAAPALAQTQVSSKPALLGGTPVRASKFPGWPVQDSLEATGLEQVLRSGKWGRGTGQTVARFEAAYAEKMGTKACLATANGTSSLLIALGALGIGPGDEVIVPPYTFVATINAILQNFALPVFVDSDRDTFQIDARKIEAAITPETAVLMPVHLGGNAADLDTVLDIATRRKLTVVEDAAQAHLAEWRGRKVGSFGRVGCFSFQASKNLNSGEGGALISNDEAFIDQCYAFHNNSRRRNTAGSDFSYLSRGLNLRLTEFQGSLLLSQMSRLEAQSKTRETNAAALTAMLERIPGIVPAKSYAHCTRNAFHLYMLRYDPAHFAGLPRAKFLKALQAEGIPGSGGYSPLNREPLLRNTLRSKGYQRIYGEKRLKTWFERNECPVNDQLCQEAVWFTQTMLLGPRTDMEQIAEAISRIQRHAAELAKS
ncbi:MAG: DegT/DnrJ/EryC1/StrS family aminotransferase [Bryobacteraceae bacterium]|nr:DegT/DnrJ/EryC1/StrS family aminotransferase [Bryobacteraceae bacterium]